MTRNEVLQAIIDGKQLQEAKHNDWYDISHETALWLMVQGIGGELRIKPEPKPDISVDCFWNFSPNELGVRPPNNVRCIYDGETGELKSVKQIGKPDPEKMEELITSIKRCNVVSHMQVDEALEPVK